MGKNLTNQLESLMSKTSMNRCGLPTHIMMRFINCKTLVGKNLTNQQPFVKFIRLFHHQSFVLYSIHCFDCNCNKVLGSQVELVLLNQHVLYKITVSLFILSLFYYK